MNILGVKFKELLNVLLIALKEGCSREVNSGGAYEALSNCFAGNAIFCSERQFLPHPERRGKDMFLLKVK